MEKTTKSPNQRLEEQINPDIVNELIKQGSASNIKTTNKPNNTSPRPNSNKPAQIATAKSTQSSPRPINKPNTPVAKPVTNNASSKPNTPVARPATNNSNSKPNTPTARPVVNSATAKPNTQPSRPVANNSTIKSSTANTNSTSLPKKIFRPRNTNNPKPQATAEQSKAEVTLESSIAHTIKSKIPNKRPIGKGTLKIIPLGGLGEIGKNITYYEYNNEALLVDCGMAFPDESMPGIDIVIPDFTFLIENQKKIKGLFITHGHEDHIGSIPYLLKHFNVPIYGTRLSIGLIEGKLKEHGLLRSTKMYVVKPGDTIKSGAMSVEFINVNHSIPDACSLAIHTPAGLIIQTGDFKVDYTPIDGDIINLARFGELGSQGVLALLSDSTNAERPGTTSSERTVGESLDTLFADAAGKRIIVATFASNVHRVQQIIDSAAKYGRKVAVSGRSMENVTTKALELGYLKVPNGIFVNIEEASKLPNGEMVIITTGSQGEPMSALTRMARGDHRQVNVTNGDYIIISATPIPGNEKLVTKVVNDLLKLGANVIYEKMYDIHVSGHACQDELKLMMALTKPKFFMPFHGEFKHLKSHAKLAVSMGIPEENILIAEIGQVVEINSDSIKQKEVVPAGKILVDGLGIGDVGSIVLRDRMHLAEDGLIVVISTIKRATGQILSGPDIVSRGFVYVRESEDMISKAKNIAKSSIEKSIKNGSREWNTIKNNVRDDVGDFVWQTTKRRPMILPVIQEVK